MDRDIHHLVFHYLLKARELAISGQEHKAVLQLGLSPEALSLLKRMPIAKLEELAQSNVTCFALRFPSQFWKDWGQENATGPMPESLSLHLLASAVMGGDDDDLTAQA